MFTHSFPRKTNAITTGLVAGTLVEGPKGWLPVEDLRIGCTVHSFDGGLARVLRAGSSLDHAKSWRLPCASARRGAGQLL